MMCSSYIPALFKRRIWKFTSSLFLKYISMKGPSCLDIVFSKSLLLSGVLK